MGTCQGILGTDFGGAGRRFSMLHVNFIFCHWVVVLFIALVEKNPPRHFVWVVKKELFLFC